MYCILMDAKTKSFYMKPNEFHFYAYSDPSMVENPPINSRLVETEFESKKELTTFLYNAGFCRGFLDGKMIVITKRDSYYFNQNSNEIAFAQFLLTNNSEYLEHLIIRDKLLTICQIQGKTILFPTIKLEDGTTAVLTYTDMKRIPKSLFTKYPNYHIVYMNFKAKCIVNNKFVTEDEER